MMKKKIIHESPLFRLSSERRRDPSKRGRGHHYYRITWHGWELPLGDEERVRDIVDPKRNIAGKSGSSWIFKDLDTAEKLYAILLLKWTQ